MDGTDPDFRSPLPAVFQVCPFGFASSGLSRYSTAACKVAIIAMHGILGSLISGVTTKCNSAIYLQSR